MKKDKRDYETNGTEEDFLKFYQEEDVHTYEKPSLTVDSVMFSYDKKENDLKLLLVKRNAHPFKGAWALPGGFVEKDEDTDTCCLRETFEETGLKLNQNQIEQLYTFSAPNRDPRTWVVSVAYMSFLPTVATLKHGSDAKDARWFSVEVSENSIDLISQDETIKMSLDGTYQEDSTGKLAFDHNKIISTAIRRIQGKISYQPTVFQILGDVFKMLEVRKVFAKFMGLKKIPDNSHFRSNHGHFFEEVGESSENLVGRPAKLFKLKL